MLVGDGDTPRERASIDQTRKQRNQQNIRGLLSSLGMQLGGRGTGKPRVIGR